MGMCKKEKKKTETIRNTQIYRIYAKGKKKI